MPTRSTSKSFRPVFYLFLGLTVLFLVLQIWMPGKATDYRVLLAGNLILFLVGMMSMNMSMRALDHKSVQIFLRLVYGSFLLKFFVLAAAAGIYIALNRKDINKPALFGCFGLYFIYTFVELRSVMKQSKKPDA